VGPIVPRFGSAPTIAVDHLFRGGEAEEGFLVGEKNAQTLTLPDPDKEHRRACEPASLPTGAIRLYSPLFSF